LDVTGHKATIWAPRGVNPVVKVSAKGAARVLVAGPCCFWGASPNGSRLNGVLRPEAVGCRTGVCGLAVFGVAGGSGEAGGIGDVC
jgi:hypothetical protein